MITVEIVPRGGEPVWRITSGGIVVEARSGIAARHLLEELEASAGTPSGIYRPISQPYTVPDAMVPDPGT